MDDSKHRVLEKLKSKYPADEKGLWRVLGEDPNPDLGGPHNRPDLGIYSGRYSEIVDLAADLPNFWQWGGGGDIEQVVVRNAGTLKRRQELELKRAELQEALNKIDRELTKL